MATAEEMLIQTVKIAQVKYVLSMDELPVSGIDMPSGLYFDNREVAELLMWYIKEILTIGGE